MLQNKYFILLVSMFLFYTFPSYSDETKRLFIEITNPHIKKLPLAIMELSNLGIQTDQELLKEIRETLEFDLDVSGIFKLIPPKAFLTQKINITNFSPDDWKVLGVNGVITTHFKLEGNQINLEFRLFNVNTGTLVVGKRYSGTKDQARTMTHYFGNELMSYYTGEPGVFSTKIAFVSNKTGTKELYTMDYDAKNIKQITYNNSINLNPDWSPNNEMLIYTSFKSGNPDIWIVNLKTNTHTQITTAKGLNTGPTWLPDGLHFIFASSSLTIQGDTDLFIMNYKTKVQKRITHSKGITISPKVSHDGKKIAFVSGRSGQPHIYTMDIDGSKIFRITYAGRYNSSPAWFPKDDKLVFAGWNNEKFDLFIVNADATNMERLTNYSQSNEESSLSPDGRLIVFQSTRRTTNPKKRKTDLFLINSNGLGERPLLIDFGEASSPSWSNRE